MKRDLGENAMISVEISMSNLSLFIKSHELHNQKRLWLYMWCDQRHDG